MPVGLLHRWTFVPGVAAIAAVWLIGGWAMVSAAYCLPWCLVAVHGASAVNYVCHRFGTRRYATGDRSTNHAFLGVVLFGEGWHNNHITIRRRRARASSGGNWMVLYWLLRGLAALGVVWDLREVPADARDAVAAEPRQRSSRTILARIRRWSTW